MKTQPLATFLRRRWWWGGVANMRLPPLRVLNTENKKFVRLHALLYDGRHMKARLEGMI